MRATMPWSKRREFCYLIAEEIKEQTLAFPSTAYKKQGKKKMIRKVREQIDLISEFSQHVT